MVSGFDIAVIIGGGLMGTACILTFVYYYNKYKPKKENPDIIWNLVPSKANGRMQGTLIRKEESTDGKRTAFTFAPKDIDVTKPCEKSVRVIVDKFILLGGSKDRRIIVLLPQNPEDLAYELKSSEFGKYLLGYINKKNIDNIDIETLRETVERKDTLRISQAGGEYSNREVQKLREHFDAVISQLTKDNRQPSPGGYPSKHGV